MLRIRITKCSGAVLAVPLDVVVFRQRRELGGLTAKLAGVTKNYFCTASIKLNFSVNLDFAALKLPDVTDMAQIASEYDARKRGIGRALVSHFLNDIRCAYVFSAIVVEPPNPTSSDFHKKMGFVPVFQSISRNSNGQTYPNQVWRRPWGPG